MELRRQTYTGEVLDPLQGFAPTRSSVEVRWDPLLGHPARLVRSRTPLLPRSNVDLEALAATGRERCPFCPERIMEATPRLRPEIHAEGRISRGEAVLFPNLLTYNQHSSVSVYSPRLHFLPLERMTDALVTDNLSTQVEFVRAVTAFDRAARWASINANHLPPSGSSILHPHLQGGVDPQPSTLQAMMAAVPASRFEDYVATERGLGERFIADTGRVRWLASFAPIGFNEVRGVVAGMASPTELDDATTAELGSGIARVLRVYAELGMQSFNMALVGAPLDGGDTLINLRMVCRSNPDVQYRSDAMYSERLHWQAMVDTSPEELAEQARPHFAG
ncbi:MAG: hypothetical protein WCB85_04460 [Candidatus Dormiibacterota bacterium]